MAENTVRIDSSTPINVTGTVTTTQPGSTTPFTTLTAASTGTGLSVDYGRAQNDITMAILVTGTVTSGTVSLQASQDGTNWVDVNSTTTLVTNTNDKLAATGEAWRYARGAITSSIIGGATVTCTLMTGG